MGGGDLNLKKSWHPSTMKNMEKVWKAEQKHEQEKKKIAELQREIREEREREEIRKFAEDGGVLEKKDECKLDWMYKGPGGIVSREDYLLGRAIDKSFDLLQEAEKESAQSSTEGNNKVFAGRSGIVDDQVDIVRKLQEDPLLLIKKKEMETRTQILNNPVKLKQLQRMLKEEKAQVSKKNKKKNKKKRKRKRSSSAEDLDQILATKYSRLRDKLNDVEMARLLSDEDDEEEEREKKKNKGKGTTTRYEDSSRDKKGGEESKNFLKGYGLQQPPGHEHKPNSDAHTGSKKEGRNDRKTKEPLRRPSVPNRSPAPKQLLTSEELEKRRREMMDNARWREEQRERNVRSQREEEKREKKATETESYDPTFLRKQLSMAASVGSVEGRIKSNINNIQRSGGAMDRNFAKR